MPLWRRRSEASRPAESGVPASESTLEAAKPTSVEPAAPVEPRTPSPSPAAPFDPTAFLAVAPAPTIDQGLERTRTGFMSQLRDLLGRG